MWNVTDATQMEPLDEVSYYQDRLGSSRGCASPGRSLRCGCWATGGRMDRHPLCGWTEEIAAGLLDEIAAAPGDVTDLLGVYARPLPIAVLCDLVSALVRDSGTADGLTGSELLATVFLLVMAGFDTTVNLIVSGTLALLTHPGGRRPGYGRTRRCSRRRRRSCSGSRTR